MFYKPKNRIWSGKGENITYNGCTRRPSRYGRNIWDRGSTNNVATCRYLHALNSYFGIAKANKVKVLQKPYTNVQEGSVGIPIPNRN